MSVGGGLLATFILSFHYRTIINMPFTCLLEEGYLISYSARREVLLIKLCPFYSALRGSLSGLALNPILVNFRLKGQYRHEEKERRSAA